MAGALHAFVMDLRDSLRSRDELRDRHTQHPDMVGRYFADYSELTDEELAASDKDADALIARSRVVSSKRL